MNLILILKFQFFCRSFVRRIYCPSLCSDSLKIEDAIYLLHERGKAMQKAVPVGKGSMIAVLGSEIEKIDELLKSIDFKKEFVR